MAETCQRLRPPKGHTNPGGWAVLHFCWASFAKSVFAGSITATYLRRQFVNSLDVMVQPHQLCPVVFVQVLEDIALTVQNQLVAKVPFCGFNVRTHASGPLC